MKDDWCKKFGTWSAAQPNALAIPLTHIAYACESKMQFFVWQGKKKFGFYHFFFPVHVKSAHCADR